MPTFKSIIPILVLILSAGRILSAGKCGKGLVRIPEYACKEVCCMLNETESGSKPHKKQNLSAAFEECCDKSTECFLGESSFYDTSCIEQFLKFCTSTSRSTTTNLTSWEKKCCSEVSCSSSEKTAKNSDKHGKWKWKSEPACFKIDVNWTNAEPETGLLPKPDPLFQKWKKENWTFFLKMASQSCLSVIPTEKRPALKPAKSGENESKIVTYQYPFYAKSGEHKSEIVYGYETPPPFLIMNKSSYRLWTAVGDSLKNLWISMFLWLTWTLISGVIIWLLDRRKNPLQFPSSFWEGVSEGTWWAVVTVTTVGYGDKTPKSLLARIYCVVWMIVGMIMFSTFTGEIASNLTSEDLMSHNSFFGKQIGVPVSSKKHFSEELKGAKLIEKNSSTLLLKFLDSPQKKIVLHDCPHIDKVKSLQAVLELQRHYIGISTMNNKEDSCLITCVGDMAVGHHGEFPSGDTSEIDGHCDMIDKDEYALGERQDDSLIPVYVSGVLVVVMFIAGSVWDSIKAKEQRKKREGCVEDNGIVGMTAADSIEAIEIKVIKDEGGRGSQL